MIICENLLKPLLIRHDCALLILIFISIFTSVTEPIRFEVFKRIDLA